MRPAPPLALLLALALPTAAAGVEGVDLDAIVVGDAIPQPLTGVAGDPARGAALIADRGKSLCLLCHAGPFPEPHAHGSIGPDLTGVGGRLGEGQIRLRVSDMRRLEPASVMPAYLRADGFERVAPAWRGQPILTAAEIEDIVALLASLRN